MADTSKKLTVSFGAFSCTLAGFDDPFPIMKRVVDYFQQLAAADPSFGASPQSPDTNVLRDIAQEQSNAKVTAELVDDEVVLHADQAIDAVGIDLPEADREALWSAMDIDALEEVGLGADQTVTTAPAPTIVNAPTAETKDQKQARIDQAAAVWTPPANQVNTETETEAATDNAALMVATDAYAEGLLSDFKAEQALAAMPQFVDAPEAETELDKENFEPVEDWSSEAMESPVDLIAEPECMEMGAAEPEVPVEANEVANVMAAFQSEPEEAIVPEPSYETAELSDWEAELQRPVQEDVAQGSSIFDEDQNEEAEATIDRILANLQKSTKPAEPAATKEATSAVPVKVSRENKPLRLGFGDQADERVELPIETNAVDFRKRDEVAAMTAMLGASVSHEAEFDYAASPDPAPLVLTQAERVDPVLQEAAEELSDLEQFARAVNATTVTELIEATAAFITVVEGRSNFTRREVLGHLDRLARDPSITQETRIKSFGSLLRGGKFIRAENGEFAMSERALAFYEDTRRIA